VGALQHNAFGPIADHLERRIAAGQEAGAKDLITDITADMGEAKHGTHWPGLENTSSAPAESPAVQSGHLVESLHTAPLGHGDWATVTTVPYALDLEYGAPARHLAARPFMVPGAHRIAPAHWRRLVRALLGKDPT
jgi:hypothetical protein